MKRPVRNVEMIHLSVMKIKFGEGNLEDFKEDWVFDRNPGRYYPPALLGNLTVDKSECGVVCRSRWTVLGL